MNDLEAAVRRVAEASGPTFLGLVCTGLDGHARAVIEADAAVHAASTMKVPVLVELFRQAEAGSIALSDLIEVRNRFRSLVDRSPFTLDPADDSERGLYGREGELVALLDLARPMITHSSNLATNLLVERLGAASISTTMRDLGFPGLVVRRGLEDDLAYAAGLNNTVTAAALAGLLAAMGRRALVSARASAAMEAILAGQAFNEGVPAGLPAGTYVAHKTGSIAQLYHDAALVRPADAAPYVLVVLTRGLDETRAAPDLVAELSALAWKGRAAGT